MLLRIGFMGNVIQCTNIFAKYVGLEADPTGIHGWLSDLTQHSQLMLHKPAPTNISLSKPLPTMNPNKKAAVQFLTIPNQDSAGFGDSSVEEWDI